MRPGAFTDRQPRDTERPRGSHHEALALGYFEKVDIKTRKGSGEDLQIVDIDACALSSVETLEGEIPEDGATLDLVPLEVPGLFRVRLHSLVEVAGYQFNVVQEDGSISDAFGGLSSEHDFTVAYSADLVLGFSLMGAVIPPTSPAELLTLDMTGVETPCLEGIVLSDPSGVAVPVLNLAECE